MDRAEAFKKDVARQVTEFYVNKKKEAEQAAKKAVEHMAADEAGFVYRHKIKGRKYFYF